MFNSKHFTGELLKNNSANFLTAYFTHERYYRINEAPHAPRPGKEVDRIERRLEEQEKSHRDNAGQHQVEDHARN